jgi:ubiquinone/menaquinone biosynthesis C-methylase UbiE
MLAVHVVLVVVALFVWVEIVARVAIALGWRVPCPFAVRFILTSPLRRWVAGPKWTFDKVRLEPGTTALELGTGAGALSVEAASRLGDGGFLVGVDIQPAMLRETRKRLDTAGVRNAALVCADAQALPFKPGVLDAVFLVTVLGEIPDVRRAVSEIRGALAEGGVFSVTEIVPDPHYCRPSTVRRLMLDGGFDPEPTSGMPMAYTIRGTKSQTGG